LKRTDSVQKKQIMVHLDSTRGYAVVLLRLLLKKFLSPKAGDHNKQWTDEMRDQLIESSCDHVFTKATCIRIFRSLCDNVDDVPVRQSFPRPTISQSFGDIEFRNEEEDFDNSQAQTGSCVVANCKQSSKIDCENVSCKTHCPTFQFQCRAHRSYPSNEPYRPRLNVKFTFDGREEPVSRDPDVI